MVPLPGPQIAPRLACFNGRRGSGVCSSILAFSWTTCFRTYSSSSMGVTYLVLSMRSRVRSTTTPLFMFLSRCMTYITLPSLPSASRTSCLFYLHKTLVRLSTRMRPLPGPTYILYIQFLPYRTSLAHHEHRHSTFLHITRVCFCGRCSRHFSHKPESTSRPERNGE